MLNALTKMFPPSRIPINKPPMSLKTKYGFASSPIIYHRLQIDTLSDKWHVDFSFTSATLNHNTQNKVRPYNYSRVFAIKFVQKSIRFVKGRPQYRIQFLPNEVLKLSYWQPNYGKFEMLRSSQYREEVFFAQKIIKNHTDQAVEQFLGTMKKQSFPLTLYRFNFYNNKLQGQKSKDFFLTESDLNLLQTTLRSSFGALTFNENREEYEIWDLQRRILKKQMPIHKENQ